MPAVAKPITSAGTSGRVGGSVFREKREQAAQLQSPLPPPHRGQYHQVHIVQPTVVIGGGGLPVSVPLPLALDPLTITLTLVIAYLTVVKAMK